MSRPEILSKGDTMRRTIIIVFCLAMTLSFTLGRSDFQKSIAPEKATLLQQGEAKTWCKICGMNLPMFYKTNHARILDDGTAHQYCSVRCLLVDGEEHSGGDLLVIDAQKEKFIPVEKAHYVVGSTVPGTMSRESKVAFGSKRAAKKFSKKHAGKQILSFDEVSSRVTEQLQADNKMLMKKRQKMVIPKGKGLYNKLKLTAAELGQYTSLLDLKVNLRALDKTSKLGEKQLQMLALYIWTGQGQATTTSSGQTIAVPEDAKCPICGMFVHKYPRWAAKVTESGLSGNVLYFDGVKDLMKYYMKLSEAERENVKILVTDYYSQKALDGKSAVFVVGSDVLGPMGHELIPLGTQSEAQEFMKDHSGSAIYSFDEINAEILTELDR